MSHPSKSRYLVVAAVVGVLALGTAAYVTPDDGAPRGDELVVHEWGTLTTVAGPDGRAIDWYPLGGPSALPCFVERFRNSKEPTRIIDPAQMPVPNISSGALSIQGRVAGVRIIPIDPQPAPVAAAPGQLRYDYQQTWENVRAKVRMETPVIYFYTQRPTTVDVTVKYPRGLMTEWYPRATVVQGDVDRATLSDTTQVSVTTWRNVAIRPDTSPAYPYEDEPSHYFSARATDAAAVVVDGQSEKFLFYRGVGNYDVPLAATLHDDGSITVENLGANAIPGVVLFTREGARIGYRIENTLKRSMVMDAPELNGDLGALRVKLERLLVAAGLFPKEAAAMVATWHDSWFEDGTRVFYVFPQPAVEAFLPLQITPAATRTERVFVGRMEVITPATQRVVAKAVAENDSVTLRPYRRFFGPIADRIIGPPSAASTGQRLAFRDKANVLLTEYVRYLTSCQ